MVEAQIVLPNGTSISVSGSVEEVQSLLEFYATRDEDQRTETLAPLPASGGDETARDSDEPDIMLIVNTIKNCEQTDEFETRILDDNSQIPRVLLPLYVCHKYLPNHPPLTSGAISKVMKELGVPIRVPNVSKVLSGTASKYVIADQARRRGTPVRYRIARRGERHLEDVLAARPS